MFKVHLLSSSSDRLLILRGYWTNSTLRLQNWDSLAPPPLISNWMQTCWVCVHIKWCCDVIIMSWFFFLDGGSSSSGSRIVGFGNTPMQKSATTSENRSPIYLVVRLFAFTNKLIQSRCSGQMFFTFVSPHLFSWQTEENVWYFKWWCWRRFFLEASGLWPGLCHNGSSTTQHNSSLQLHSADDASLPASEVHWRRGNSHWSS